MVLYALSEFEYLENTYMIQHVLFENPQNSYHKHVSGYNMLIDRLHSYIQSTPSSPTIQQVENTQFHLASPLHDVNHSHRIINHHLPPQQGLAYHRPRFCEVKTNMISVAKKIKNIQKNIPPWHALAGFLERSWDFENTAFVNKKSHSIWGSTMA